MMVINYTAKNGNHALFHMQLAVFSILWSCNSRNLSLTCKIIVQEVVFTYFTYHKFQTWKFWLKKCVNYTSKCDILVCSHSWQVIISKLIHLHLTYMLIYRWFCFVGWSPSCIFHIINIWHTKTSGTFRVSTCTFLKFSLLTYKTGTIIERLSRFPCYCHGGCVEGLMTVKSTWVWNWFGKGPVKYYYFEIHCTSTF
jgi:hypothetical protein